jgi:hypothetical protein
MAPVGLGCANAVPLGGMTRIAPDPGSGPDWLPWSGKPSRAEPPDCQDHPPEIPLVPETASPADQLLDPRAGPLRRRGGDPVPAPVDYSLGVRPGCGGRSRQRSRARCPGLRRDPSLKAGFPILESPPSQTCLRDSSRVQAAASGVFNAGSPSRRALPSLSSGRLGPPPGGRRLPPRRASLPSRRPCAITARLVPSRRPLVSLATWKRSKTTRRPGGSPWRVT